MSRQEYLIVEITKIANLLVHLWVSYTFNRLNFVCIDFLHTFSINIRKNFLYNKYKGIC